MTAHEHRRAGQRGEQSTDPHGDAALTLDDLFDHRGSDRLAYSARCGHLSGGWLQFETLVARNHDGSRWLAVDQPGACPDCSAVPVAALQLPGFEPPADLPPDRPLRLRGRLSYGFAVDAEGNASFLRLEDAECVGVATPAGRNDTGETT